MSNTNEISEVLEAVSFRGKNLLEWSNDLTVMMPALPATNLAIQKAVAMVNDKYQTAYNCYNELMVIHSRTKSRYDNAKDSAVSAKRQELIQAGVKLPAKEVLENIAVVDNVNARNLRDELSVCTLIMDFFENNKNKLEKSMQLVLNIAFSISQADKMHYKSGEPKL